jgi:hypothetical protein
MFGKFKDGLKSLGKRITRRNNTSTSPVGVPQIVPRVDSQVESQVVPENITPVLE